MIKATTTWVGPMDKLVIDGKLYRDSYLDSDAETAYLQSVPGRIGTRSVTVLSNSVVIVDTFDTLTHAEDFIQTSSRSWQEFLDGPLGVDNESAYMRDNGLTSTTVYEEI